MPLRRGPGPLAILALTLLLGAQALASKPRCRLERVQRIEDRVEALGGVVELEGEVEEKPPQACTLLVNGKAAARGQRSQAFGQTRAELDVVLAVEISALYAKAIGPLKEAISDFLEDLPPTARVKLLPFGNEIDQRGPFQPPGSLSGAVEDLNPDDEGEVQLMNAVNAGLVALNKVRDKDREQRQKSKDAAKRPPSRYVMVIVSDGLDPVMDRRRFRALGDQLRKAGVPLFPIAFSPADDRGPLLNLGELAKRSAGTFRWAEKAEGLKAQLHALAEELKQTQVLTFTGGRIEKLVPEDAEDFAKLTFTMRCEDLVSNPYRAGEALDRVVDGGWAWWKYVLAGLGALVGLWGLAQGAVFLLRRRAQAVPAPYPPGQVPMAGGYPQAPMTGGYPQAPATGAYPQTPPTAPMTGGYPPAPVTGAYPQTPPTAPMTGGYPQTPPAARLAEATLIMIGGQHGGQRVPVGEGLVLGKAVSGPGTLAITDDATVSSRHCELRRHGAGFALFDLGSTNGTFVNDQRLAAPRALTDGDLVRLGTGTQFKFRLD